MGGAKGKCKNSPTLSEFEVDRTEVDVNGELDEVCERDGEIRSCLRYFGVEDNPCLMG